MSKLTISEFGAPILRAVALPVVVDAINGSEVQALIRDIRELLHTKNLGVGLAAPQVGKGIALSVISVRPSKRRPNAKEFDLVIINPRVVRTIGRRSPMYEGCISGGPGKAGLFAQVPRYKKLELEYYDENGVLRADIFDGFAAHVIQHEVDHLNGILFVDKVRDTKSYLTYKEYLKYIKTKTN